MSQSKPANVTVSAAACHADSVGDLLASARAVCGAGPFGYRGEVLQLVKPIASL